MNLSLIAVLLLEIVEKKSRETREATYTCRHTSGHLIPNSFVGIELITD